MHSKTREREDASIAASTRLGGKCTSTVVIEFPRWCVTRTCHKNDTDNTSVVYACPLVRYPSPVSSQPTASGGPKLKRSPITS